MLRKLITAIAEGQARSLGELAKQLGVSAGLIEQMLEDLVRQGYLRLTSMECASGCAGCPSATTCNLTQPVKTWVLTEKGHEAAERSSAAERSLTEVA